MSVLWFSICSPIVEVFPNLYMSWWRPANGNIVRYLRLWFLRVGVVLVVWVPILGTFWGLASSTLEGLAVPTLVAAAFGLRLVLFDRYLKNTARGDFAPRVSILPEGLYFIAFSWIGYRLFATVSWLPELVPLGIALIFSGAGLMGHFRETEPRLWADRAGRLVFAIGFAINLFNLDRAAA